MSKSLRKYQNATACKPEQKVNVSEISASDLQIERWRIWHTIALKPVTEISKSSGKKEKFQACNIGLS